jgi:hypothetical protein
MALTVNDLILVWEIKAAGYKDSLPAGVTDRIKLLNAAKEMVWQRIVNAGRSPKGSGNWFVKSTSLALTSSEREKDLPTDFHDVVFVESVTATWEAVAFEAQDFYKQPFRARRRTAATVGPEDGTRMYVIAGDVPAKFILDKKCAGGITLTVWYTSILPEWTATTDSVTRIPNPYQDAIVNLAAMMSAMSRQDAALSGLYKTLWDENKELIDVIASGRQYASAVSQQPADNVG